MTVEEARERLTHRELIWWDEWFCEFPPLDVSDAPPEPTSQQRQRR